jgi:hypothetical protein
MKNSIVISSEFFFKGQKLAPSMVIDLDAFIANQSSTESFPPLLAKSNHIDPYSYEYEILLSEPLRFSAATGLAKNFLHHGEFDFAGFEQAWREEQIVEIVSAIARSCLSVDDLSAKPDLRAALIAAFKRGQQA